MPESYETTSIREITDVNTSTDELENFIEVTAKTKPHGIAFSMRIADDGSDPSAIVAQIAARAQYLEALASA